MNTTNTQPQEQSKVRNRNKISTRLRELNEEWRTLCDDCLDNPEMTDETKALIIGFYAQQMKSLARMMKSTLRSFRADSQRKPSIQFGDAEKTFGEYATELLKMNLKHILEHELNFIG